MEFSRMGLSKPTRWFLLARRANARDKKRIDKLVDRIAARSEQFGAVDGFPNGSRPPWGAAQSGSVR